MNNSQQHIPIFVGSTYLDLKEHREKVRETLGRMGTYVNGMEQFGARSGAPLKECLAEVAKSKIYVGIFAMRYGTVLEGYQKSLTHLEYEEAQRWGLPSYIFLIDDKVPITINIKDVDIENFNKLKELKDELLATHTCDFFVSPDDLANKVGTAIHHALQEEKVGHVEIDCGIENVIPTESKISGEKILRRFKTLPQRWQGMEFELSIVNYKFHKSHSNIIHCRAATPYQCNKLNLRESNSIVADWCSADSSNEILIIAENKIADELIDIDYDAWINIVAETIYYKPELDEGITYYPQLLDEDREEEIFAIKVKRILDILHVSSEDDIPF